MIFPLFFQLTLGEGGEYSDTYVNSSSSVKPCIIQIIFKNNPDGVILFYGLKELALAQTLSSKISS